jgi:2-polyprenyl-3-methyl-5-hydroxy-6-metoxy-1,4-benzoquinol methylase
MLNKPVQPKNKQGVEAINEALTLNYQSENLMNYYDKWANNYDRDVQDEQYNGPEYIADYLSQFSKNINHHLAVDPSNQHVSILDAGCGTGLVGLALHKKGYTHIDGFDLSNSMVTQARQTGAYQTLHGECDMLKEIPAYQDNQYDVIVCCGVFTTGHVPPIALKELIRITKQGGLVVSSTRKSYYDTTEFKTVCEQLQQTNHVKLIDYVMDAPYLAEEGAHYWAFEVL